jgi:hypothetical protein
MSGIMTAVAGSLGSGTLYSAGWFEQYQGTADTSPITETLTSNFSTPESGTYTWVGYLRPTSTASYTLGISTTRSDPSGLGATSTGTFRIGANAISGGGAANITTNNSSGTYVISLTQGLYYPCRFTWSWYLPYIFFSGTNTSGTATFTLNSSTNVSGLIFYNSATNGF